MEDRGGSVVPTRYFYVTNLQGDVTAIMNGSGTVVVEYTYDAWGYIRNTTGSMAATLGKANALRYRGYIYDTETSLYYLQSRYYNPGTGRFINADALVSTGQGLLGNNMFAYCNNNPVVYVDSLGTKTEERVALPLVYVIIIDNQNSGSGGGTGGGGGISPKEVLVIALLSTLINAIRYASNISKKGNDGAVYYRADIYGGTWRQLDGPMTFDEAATWAVLTAIRRKNNKRASWGLYTKNEGDALAMAIYLGGSAKYIHHDKDKGHYAHYHTANRQICGIDAESFHMWYGEAG